MFVIWLLFTLFTYHSCVKPCCEDGAATTEDAIDPVPPTGADTLDGASDAAKRYALDFKWDDPTAYTNTGFDAMKANLLKDSTGGKILVIEGLYYENEKAPEGFENMGLARAAEIRKLFPNIPDDRIRLRARTILEEPEGVRENYFEAANFKWEDAPDAYDSGSSRSTVEDVGDRIIIRFPYNSTQKIYDAAVDDYLDKLATRIKETGEKVTLTGHTDSDGPDEANLSLGRARAREIRTILTDKGVNASQITIDSKGETQPVASNATDAGKQENRRVEVVLLKQN